MRKDRRLTKDQLAPYMVEIPAAYPHLRIHTSPLEGEVGSGVERTIREGGQGGETTPLPVEPMVPPTSPSRGEVVLDWSALFGNANPVEVEVGFGKGLFLVSSGVANPHVNYFGIEIVRKYQLYATTRAAVRKLPNVKTCCADAKAVLRDHIPPSSVRTVHVFFPDPWWKTRHKKRLLFTPDFAAAVLRVLEPGGVLHFVTDVADYFQMVTELLAGVPAFALLPPPDENTPQHDMDYLTNFERKFRKEGRPIYRSRYERRSPSPLGERG